MALVERSLEAEWPLTTPAQLLSLNRSSLYHRPVVPSAEELALKRRIDALYTAHPFYGVRRITAQLRRDGLLVNHKAVARHLREMGLAGITPGPNLSRRQQEQAVYPYLLRGVTASAANHVWGIDIAYIRLAHGWLYLVAVLDWYSRYVLSWELDQTLEMPFVLTAVQSALLIAVPRIWNSDHAVPAAQRSGRVAISPARNTLSGCKRPTCRLVHLHHRCGSGACGWPWPRPGQYFCGAALAHG